MYVYTGSKTTKYSEMKGSMIPKVKLLFIYLKR